MPWSKRPDREGHCYFSCLGVFYDSCGLIFIFLERDAPKPRIVYLSPVSKYESVLNERNAKLDCATSMFPCP